MTTIITENLTRLYQGGAGIKKINVEIRRGEVFGLIGPNGSGKSTLIRVLSTLLPPSEGFFKILGSNGTKNKDVRKKIGVLFEGVSHFDDLTGFENAWFFGRTYGMDSSGLKERIDFLFEWMGLAHYKDSKVRTYSYGMKRKLGITEAILHDPDILLLDEPSVGLDYTSKLRLYEYIEGLSKKGKTIVIATNDVMEAEHLCRRIAFVYKGQVIEIGSPDEFLSGLSGTEIIEIKIAEPMDVDYLRGINGIFAVTATDNIIHILSNAKNVLPDAIKEIVETGSRITDVKVKQPNLGDVFVRMTGEKIK